MNRQFLQIGAVLGFLGVALGAFGTHSLRGRVPESDLTIWATGVQYQGLHAVALLVVALLSAHVDSPLVRRAGWCFTVGVVVFSGSLYALVLSGVRVLGAITPIGGVCFLAGWFMLALAASKKA